MPNAAVAHLGRMLRDLRKSRGLTGVALSNVAPLSQSAISKIETGKSGIPSWKLIMEILKALRATSDEVDQFRRQYELAQLDPSSYRYMIAHGVDTKQRQLALLEESARLIRDFQSAVIPGLLQTPSYAAALFKLLGHSPENAKLAARERQIRQVVLNDPCKQFYFITMDCAIYSFRTSSEEHLQQLRYLRGRLGAENLSFRVLDSRQGVPVSLPNSFMIVDRRYVSAEEAIREITTSTISEVREYETLFRELGVASLNEVESATFLDKAIDDLST